MRLLPLLLVFGCAGGADTEAPIDTDPDADTDADTDSDTDADTDSDTDADSDADTDSDSDADTDSDTDTDPPDDGWGGTWEGGASIAIEEGGFVLAEGTCDVTLSVTLPDAASSGVVGTASFTCAPSGMSASSWTLAGDTLTDSTWSGTALVDVPTFGASETVTFAATRSGDTASLTIGAGHIPGGEWYYDWPDVTIALTRAP